MKRLQNIKQGSTTLRAWLLPAGEALGGAASSLPTEALQEPCAELPSEEFVAAAEDRTHAAAVEVPAAEESSQHHKDAGRGFKCTTKEQQQVEEERQEEEFMVHRENTREDSGIEQEEETEEAERQPLSQTNALVFSQDHDEDVWRYEPPMNRSLKAQFFLHDKSEHCNTSAGHLEFETAVPIEAGCSRGCSGMCVRHHRILALASGTLVAGLVAAVVVLWVRRGRQAATDEDLDSGEPNKADFRAHMERIYGSPQATFEAMDGDGDGRASFNGFADELRRFWPALNLTQANYTFAGLDCNEDRTLELFEFIHGVIDSPEFFDCITTSTTSTTATTVTSVTNTTTTSTSSSTTATGTVTDTTTSCTSSTTTSSTTTSSTTTSSTSTSVTITKTSTLTMTSSTTTITPTQTVTATSTTTSTSRTITVTTTTTTTATTTTTRKEGWWNWLDPLKSLNPFENAGFLHPATTTSTPMATAQWTTTNPEMAAQWTTTTPEMLVQTTLAYPEALLLGSWVSDKGVSFTIHKTLTGQLRFSIQVGLNQEVSSLLEADGPWLNAQLSGVGMVRLRVLKHGLPETTALLSNFRDASKLGWGPDTILHRVTVTPQPPAVTTTTAPVSAPLMTFYMYRAQDEENYEVMNNNLGNLAGVLWYLHHEVVPLCPRHYGITRILRYKVTIKPTIEVFNAAIYRPNFGPFVAMDLCRCTTPGCPSLWEHYGYAPGCQEQVPGPDYFYPLGVWYSLPGPCPSENCWHKSQACKASEPGGRCPVPNGTRECTWHLEDAGEIDLDELVGISNHTAFCKAGKQEFVPHLDRGVGVTFWDGYRNKMRCEERVRRVEGLFNSKFPGLPGTMPEPKCLAVPR